jgi:hypothetical protein
MRGAIHQQAEVAWANILESTTQEVLRHLGPIPDDGPRRDEVFWAAAAGLAAGLDSLMRECARRDLTLDDFAGVVREERQQLELHRARTGFPRPATD